MRGGFTSTGWCICKPNILFSEANVFNLLLKEVSHVSFSNDSWMAAFVAVAVAAFATDAKLLSANTILILWHSIVVVDSMLSMPWCVCLLETGMILEILINRKWQTNSGILELEIGRNYEKPLDLSQAIPLVGAFETSIPLSLSNCGRIEGQTSQPCPAQGNHVSNTVSLAHAYPINRNGSNHALPTPRYRVRSSQPANKFPTPPPSSL